MSSSPSNLFSRSLLAAAVLTAAGCATTTARAPGEEPGIGDSLADAGRSTLSAGRQAVHRTGYLLGLHDDAGNGLSTPMDEVDRAMLEEDAPWPAEDAVQVADARVERAIARPAGNATAHGPVTIVASVGPGPSTPPEPSATGELEVVTMSRDEPSEDEGDLIERATDESIAGIDETRPAAAPAVVATRDHVHRVGDEETLWDIAKKTTGDANDWHTLADLNDLGPTASVYPGQAIVVPADMLRPELAGVASSGSDASGVDPDELRLAAASPVAPAALEPEDDATGFELDGGESLWDLAKRTTGDATNWQAIAAHNGFDESQAARVRAGQEIFVPVAMVRTDRDPLGGSDIADAAPEAPVSEVPVPEAPARSEPATDDIAAAVALESAGDDDTAPGAAPRERAEGEEPIRIVEAAYRSDDETPEQAPVPDTLSEVTISGTYYPKAVYNEADFTSSLLMRVSPGTRLTVSSVAGPWYRVVTDEGTGYVHDRDIR